MPLPELTTSATNSWIVLQVHTGHDAENLRPGDNVKEHSARQTSKTSPAYATAGVDDERNKLVDCPSGSYRP